jgi:hypothetical protein
VLDDGAQNQPADAAEPVDGDANGHENLRIVPNCALARGFAG